MSLEKVLNNKSSLVVADLELDSNIQVPTYDHYRKDKNQAAHLLPA